MRDLDTENVMTPDESRQVRALVLDGTLNPLTNERITGGYQEVLDLIDEGAYRYTGYAETPEEVEALKERTLERIRKASARRRAWDEAVEREEKRRAAAGLPID